MNTAIRLIKAHSLKASLPLLLLVTACGEGGSTAQQSDQAIPAAEPVLAAAQPSGSFGAPSVESAPLNAPQVELPDSEEGNVSFEDVLPPAEGTETGTVASTGGSATAESVPEPAALAGLGLAAAGLITLKRKQSA